MIFEEWRTVVGHPGYEVSSIGRLRSHMRGRARILRATIGSRGYRKVSIAVDGCKISRTIHSLAAEAFAGARPDGAVVRHLDGDSLNNCAENLCWGTPSENTQDMMRHGRAWQRNKTHCPQDHPYSDVNTMFSPEGHRRCKVCHRAKIKRQRAAKRSAERAA